MKEASVELKAGYRMGDETDAHQKLLARNAFAKKSAFFRHHTSTCGANETKTFLTGDT